MEEIDVAIFAFDSEHKLRLVNRAGEKILAKPAERLTGRSAEELDLAECLEGEPARILQTSFPSGPGRWGMRRSMFREHGLPMQLLVIGDLTRPLREEELAAWQRLVRVLGHELNKAAKHPDADAMHDIRVAIRRLRQCLDVFAPLWGSRTSKSISKRVRGLLKAAGEVRNLDIAIDLLKKARLAPPRNGLPGVKAHE